MCRLSTLLFKMMVEVKQIKALVIIVVTKYGSVSVMKLKNCGWPSVEMHAGS